MGVGYDFDGMEIYRTRVVVVGRSAEQETAASTVDIRSLAGETLFAMPRTIWSLRQLDLACEYADFVPRVEVETTAPALVALSEAGVGLSVLADDNIVHPGRPYPTLVDVDNRELATAIHLRWRSGSLAPAAAQFVAHVQSTLNTGC